MKHYLAYPTIGPWFVLKQDAEHALISNTAGREWGQIEHYVGKVRANNAQLVAAAPDLLAALQEIRSRYASLNEHGAIEVAITPELYALIETAIARATEQPQGVKT